MTRWREEFLVTLIGHLVGIAIVTPVAYFVADWLGHPIGWGLALLIAVVVVVGGVLIIDNTDLD